MGSWRGRLRWQSGEKSWEHRGPSALGVLGITPAAATFCASLLCCSRRQALEGTFIPLITQLVPDLMREICPFICAFFPSSSDLKKKKKDQHHKSFVHV